MANKKKNFIITILVVMVFSIYVGLYTHSPHYVLGYGANPYITEAKEFFGENSEKLQLLAELVSNNEERFYFTFHYPQYNTPGIPADIEAVLLELEENTKKNYLFEIYKNNISISIKSDTHLQVSLKYSIPPYRDLYENERIYDFGEGWFLHTLYVIRG